jgi:hypothetical protein
MPAMTTERGGPRYGWLVGLVAVLAAGVGAALFAVPRLRSAPAEEARPHEQAELDTADYLAPLETRGDPRTGEETAPFTGFAVSVETEPEDALVTIAGVERGESPVLAGVACRPGERVVVRAEKAGYRPARAATTCRQDLLVKLTLRLSR